MQRVAELELLQQDQGQGQGPGQAQTLAQGEARGVKHEADDDDQQLGTAVTEQGSPVRKRVKKG